MADDSDHYRRKADQLLRQATQVQNMRERSRLIDEAAHWSRLAMEGQDGGRDLANDNTDRDEDEAQATGG